MSGGPAVAAGKPDTTAAADGHAASTSGLHPWKLSEREQNPNAAEQPELETLEHQNSKKPNPKQTLHMLPE